MPKLIDDGIYHKFILVQIYFKTMFLTIYFKKCVSPQHLYSLPQSKITMFHWKQKPGDTFLIPISSCTRLHCQTIILVHPSVLPVVLASGLMGIGDKISVKTGNMSWGNNKGKQIIHLEFKIPITIFLFLIHFSIFVLFFVLFNQGNPIIYQQIVISVQLMPRFSFVWRNEMRKLL